MPLGDYSADGDYHLSAILDGRDRQIFRASCVKPMGDNYILRSKTASAVECLHDFMNLPTNVVITGCDSLPILQQSLNSTVLSVADSIEGF